MNLQEAIVVAGYTPQAYSGRGMYGKECLSARLRSWDSQTDFIIDVALACEADKEILETLRRLRMDELGQGAIVYFPSVPFVK